MSPTDFPEANTTFGPPRDLEESQCHSIRAYKGVVKGGSCDGTPLTVVAWMPTAEELLALAHGQPLYISFLGGLPPHFPTTHISQALNPA